MVLALASLVALSLGLASVVQTFPLACLAPRRQLPYRPASWCGSDPPGRPSMSSSEVPPMTAASTVVQAWDADLYQDKHSFVWKYGSSLLDLVSIEPGDRVLDVGCGTGELTQLLYQKSGGTARVVGMDADPSMVRRATEQFGGSDGDGPRFMVGDACNFLLEEPVDVLFSNAALHWIGRHGAAAAAMCLARVLRHDGRFVFEFGGKGNIETILNAILRVLNLPRESADFWYYPSISHFSNLLEEQGLEVTQAELFDRPTDLMGEDGMKEWLKMFGNKFFEERNQQDIERAIDRIVEEVRPKLYRDGKWLADYRRIRVCGRKRHATAPSV